MGTRVVFEIMTEGLDYPAVTLFNNNSHPEIDPVAVFSSVVDNNQFASQVAEALMGMRYDTAGGIHRQGDRMFAIVEAPHGDFEFIMRLGVDGGVTRIDQSEPKPQPCWVIHHSGAPWVGDWVPHRDVVPYVSREAAEAKNASLGGRFYIYAALPEPDNDGARGYRLTDKL